MQTATVLSPHLDDAALSAAARMMRPGTEVVTVFSGPPPAHVDITDWDRLTKASSSRDRHAERLAEDDEATRLLGCPSRRLDEPEREYRKDVVDLSLLAARLASVLRASAEVWVPAGIGGHSDHLSLRDAARRAAGALSRAPEVHFYADIPYSIPYGWPTWVTGDAPLDYLDVDYWIHTELVSRGLDPAALRPEVHELTRAERARKERAVRAYRTQLPALQLDSARSDRWDSLLRFEVSWRPLVQR